jgi:hypothetical protein
MRPRPLRLGLLLLLAALALAAPAAARDPQRWHGTAHHEIPIQWYQGMTAGGGSLFFDGIENGLYRATPSLRQTAGVGDGKLIPPSVVAADHYNHIGDIAFDPREGGRVLLPLECYDGTNCAGTGAIGVADAHTLAWRYEVKLDPRDIPKAMWCEVSPDGRLLWTSSGGDLLAYRMAAISRAHAAPGAAPLRPVRRLAGAVPPSGVTGAAFYAGRLFLAGAQGHRFQVWSVDPRTGRRRLEIERTLVGESEGLAVVDALGGVLHWMIQPIPDGSVPPTYAKSTILSFVPRVRPRIAVRPARLVARRATTVRVRVTATVLGRARALAGARVALLGASARTDARGRALLRVRAPRAGAFRLVAAWRGDRAARRVRAVPKK